MKILGRSTNEIKNRLDLMSFNSWKRLRQALSPHRGTPETIFVAGVHRSGTNMLIDILDASMQTDVFAEADKRAFDHFMMRDLSVIQGLVSATRAPVVVVKALHEAHSLTALMQRFAPARAYWMVRNYEDMVNSNQKRFPQGGRRNMIDKLVKDRNSAEWRGRGMTDETLRIVREHYRENMSDPSATALFWYYRNQLFFDQGFDRNDRVLAIQYEDLVTNPAKIVGEIAQFAGIQCSARMVSIPHAESVRKNAPPDISPDVRALCQAMQDRLRGVTSRISQARAA